MMTTLNRRQKHGCRSSNSLTYLVPQPDEVGAERVNVVLHASDHGMEKVGYHATSVSWSRSAVSKAR